MCRIIRRPPLRRGQIGWRDRRRVRPRRRSGRDEYEVSNDPERVGSEHVTVNIRRARPGDEAELVAMMRALADFEHALDQCTVTEGQLNDALFGEHATVYAHLAEVDGEPAAMALWFRNFSTWDGVAGIYLEDLFVKSTFRRHGLARALLSTLAKECVDNGYTRLT